MRSEKGLPLSHRKVLFSALLVSYTYMVSFRLRSKHTNMEPPCQSLHWVSGRSSSPWAAFCCFPYCMSRELDREWSSLEERSPKSEA